MYCTTFSFDCTGNSRQQEVVGVLRSSHNLNLLAFKAFKLKSFPKLYHANHQSGKILSKRTLALEAVRTLSIAGSLSFENHLFSDAACYTFRLQTLRLTHRLTRDKFYCLDINYSRRWLEFSCIITLCMEIKL